MTTSATRVTSASSASATIVEKITGVDPEKIVSARLNPTAPATAARDEVPVVASAMTLSPSIRPTGGAVQILTITPLTVNPSDPGMFSRDVTVGVVGQQ